MRLALQKGVRDEDGEREKREGTRRGRRREDGNEGREEGKTSKHTLKTIAVYPMIHTGKHDTFQAI